MHHRIDQRNAIGNVNYSTPDRTAFLTLSGDDQKLGFPGGRTVDPSIGLNQLVTNRQGTNTPFDYGNQQGASATAGCSGPAEVKVSHCLAARTAACA